MRSRFDRDLDTLNTLLIEMGALIETAISAAVVAMREQNVKLAKSVIAMDDEIDAKEKDIEQLCLKLLLQQQPVAKDLRLISAALKMITDMERIGDQAADISEITINLAEAKYVKKLEHIPQMGQATIKMVNDCIDAFVRHDLELAEAVIKYDDNVDKLFELVRDELIALIHQKLDDGEQAIDLLMIAKYFERIGDHATNIAEWVSFSITGTHIG